MADHYVYLVCPRCGTKHTLLRGYACDMAAYAPSDEWVNEHLYRCNDDVDGWPGSDGDDPGFALMTWNQYVAHEEAHGRDPLRATRAAARP